MTRAALWVGAAMAATLPWMPVAVRAADDLPGYVTTLVCAGCHAAAHAAWSGSHHDLAMQPATRATVLGDFADVTFEHLGVTSRFFERDGKLYVNTEGADGRRADFEIKYTFGITPLQQYLIELEDGRIQALDIAWDVAGERWYALYPDEPRPPGDGLHWTGTYMSWNARCADCHSTDLIKNYDPERHAYATTWSDIDVGCEACHGPGEAHVAWARDPGAYQPGAGDDPHGLIQSFASDDPLGQVETCARCHALREQISPAWRPGRPLLDDYAPSLLREGMYHADGQILGEVYVYGSFLQSRMNASGVRCSDCHDPHSLQLRAEGNGVCTQCHNPEGNARFPSLKPALYDAAEHHFHPAGSEGAKCASCHMPARTYMGVDPRRDHSFRVPRPDLSVALGTPNACTMCHTERSDQWAAETVREWYPDGRAGDPHFAAAIAAGRAGDPDGGAQLAAVAIDKSQPAIVRATAVSLLGRYGAAGAEAAYALLGDDQALVRRAALGALEGLPPDVKAQALAPLLADPVRAVRTEAARVLTGIPVDRFAPADRPALAAAQADYRGALEATADFPETQMNLAGVAYAEGRPEAAIEALEAALEMDPQLAPAWLNLAQLHHLAGRSAEAEATFQAGLEAVPDEGQLHYSFGLLLAELGRSEEAALQLQAAAALMPDHVRARYNLALLYDQLGRADDAEAALLEAHRLDPPAPDVLVALAHHYLQRGRFDDAATYARRLAELYPDRPEGRALLEQIRQAAGG